MSPLPSSITTKFCLVAVTTRSRFEFCNSCLVGFIINSPEIIPTRTAPIGPFQGTSLRLKAAEAAFIAAISGIFAEST